MAPGLFQHCCGSSTRAGTVPLCCARVSHASNPAFTFGTPGQNRHGDAAACPRKALEHDSCAMLGDRARAEGAFSTNLRPAVGAAGAPRGRAVRPRGAEGGGRPCPAPGPSCPALPGPRAALPGPARPQLGRLWCPARVQHGSPRSRGAASPPPPPPAPRRLLQAQHPQGAAPFHPRHPRQLHAGGQRGLLPMVSAGGAAPCPCVPPAGTCGGSSARGGA